MTPQSIRYCKFLEQAKNLKDKNKYVFRGLQKIEYACTTSFSRALFKSSQKKDADFGKMLSITHRLLADSLKHMSGKPEIRDKTLWTYIQHFFEKTNLLDVTTCPKVALTFASQYGTNKETHKIIAFKVEKDLKNKKQTDFQEGYGVSLIEPLNTLFPEKESKVSSEGFANNERIKAQKGAFLYCTRHIQIPGKSFKFDQKYASDQEQAFDFEKYFNAQPNLSFKRFNINPNPCSKKCIDCKNATIDKYLLFPSPSPSKFSEYETYKRIIYPFLNLWGIPA